MINQIVIQHKRVYTFTSHIILFSFLESDFTMIKNWDFFIAQRSSITMRNKDIILSPYVSSLRNNQINKNTKN